MFFLALEIFFAYYFRCFKTERLWETAPCIQLGCFPQPPYFMRYLFPELF